MWVIPHFEGFQISYNIFFSKISPLAPSLRGLRGEWWEILKKSPPPHISLMFLIESPYCFASYAVYVILQPTRL